MVVEYRLGENRVTGRPTISVFTPHPSKAWAALTWSLGAGRFALVDGRATWNFTLPSNEAFRARAVQRIADAVRACFGAELVEQSQAVAA
ncbi:hypothetical protein [Gryllotalpicola protaetiae]|uniref:Uncharacterized protein n=1 Tax=Gryllotalpicola protaetiae TaxID=2419771 RepID=A0A387BM06_9MICO|nr:hypothetical protein [Gryllotalpicola protaetiae]AYG03412.1 hypothetical protein D7I44_07605 [Gryllotalpicola protaetiae]